MPLSFSFAGPGGKPSFISALPSREGSLLRELPMNGDNYLLTLQTLQQRLFPRSVKHIDGRVQGPGLSSPRWGHSHAAAHARMRIAVCSPECCFWSSKAHCDGSQGAVLQSASSKGNRGAHIRSFRGKEGSQVNPRSVKATRQHAMLFTALVLSSHHITRVRDAYALIGD